MIARLRPPALFDAAVLRFDDAIAAGGFRCLVLPFEDGEDDADTVRLLVDGPCEARSEVAVRVWNLYCAEKRTPAGQRAIADRCRLLPDWSTRWVRFHRTRYDRAGRTFVRYEAELRGPPLVVPAAPFSAWVDYRGEMRALGHDGQGIGAPAAR